MKKSILSIALVAAIAVAGAWNFAQNQEEVTLSDLALENVDALALEDIGDGSYQTMRYCGRNLNYACVNTPTAESCRHHCP
jgi:hypothetical protein